jgi:two-component system LytT family response regulator
MPVYIFIRYKGRNEKVLLADILYIRACKNYTVITLEDKTYWVLHTMRQWENLLPPDAFCRIHRSYIVALDKILSFDRKAVLISNHQQLPAGDEYYSRLESSVLILDHSWSARR